MNLLLEFPFKSFMFTSILRITQNETILTILNSHTELGLPVREVEGAVSVAEESCMLVGSRKLLFVFQTGREPAHRSPIIFNINIRRTTLAIKKEQSQITRAVTLLFVLTFTN